MAPIHEYLNKIVFVRWIDSYYEAGWDTLSNKLNDDGQDGQCKSIGWVVQDDADWLGLVNHRTGTDHVHDLFRIPKVAIKEIIEVPDPEAPAVAYFPGGVLTSSARM